MTDDYISDAKRNQDFTMSAHHDPTIPRRSDLTPERLVLSRLVHAWADVFDAFGEWLDTRQPDLPPGWSKFPIQDGDIQDET